MSRFIQHAKLHRFLIREADFMMTSSNGNISRITGLLWGEFTFQLHQPRLWFITGGYLVKRWFIPAAARARGQSNDLNREILASNLFNCHKEVINTPPVPSISRCIHIVYRHKNVWEYQWSNFIYNCMSTFLHYVHCKDALLDCSAPGGERYESLTWVDEIPHTKGSDAELWCFPLICTWTDGWVNNRDADDLIRHRAHYDFIVMFLNALSAPHYGNVSWVLRRVINVPGHLTDFSKLIQANNKENTK